jgi:drug/metabolite transporter (DMT)-like permease
MALLGWLAFRGARPSLAVAIGLLFGFGGIALLLNPAQGSGAQVDLLGAGVVLVAAICWASGSLYSRSSALPTAPLLSTGMEMLAGGVLLLLAGTALGEWGTLRLQAVTLSSWLALGYLIVFGSLVGFTAYTWVLRATVPAVASTYAYVNPLVAVFLGWSFISEPVTSRTLLAAGVIVVGVLVITTFQGRGHARRTVRKLDQPEAHMAASSVARAPEASAPQAGAPEEGAPEEGELLTTAQATR